MRSITRSCRFLLCRRARAEGLECRRLLNAGDPDPAFSGDGRMSLNFPGAAFTIMDSTVLPNGKVVLGGTKGGSMAVARLNVDGTVDLTFGNGGLYESTRQASVTSLAAQGDGRIIMSFGPSNDPVDIDLPIGRLLENGAGFDFSFGNEGIAHAGNDRFYTSRVYDVAVQRDGKIIGAGIVDDALLIDYDFAVVRYDANGALDPSFDGDGVSVHGLGSDHDKASAVTIDYNGNSATNPLYGTIVVVGGRSGSDAGGVIEPDRFQIMRLRTDGSLDSGFDGDGRLTSPNLSTLGLEFARDVAIQPDGKIVVAGTSISGSDTNYRHFLVARYTSAGVLDASFGFTGAGYSEIDLGGRDEAGAIAVGYLNTPGNLIISGSRDNQMALVALTPDGQLDTRFSGDGILTTTIGGHATALFATGNLFPPVRKLVFAGGNSVARYVDVGSLISVGTFQPNMYEQGSVGTSFVVTRTQALPFAETIVLTTSGTVTPTGASRDFNATGILWGNGQTTSTQVTIPAGATSVNVVLTPIDDALSEGDETITFFVNTSLTYDASATRTTTLVVRDNDFTAAPAVTASAFQYDTYPQSATITFNQNVQSSFTVGDLVVTGPGATPPLYSLNYDNVTNTGTVVFYNGLADGDYSVRVKGSGVTVNGTPMAADYTFGFFFLRADANHDRAVNFDDLLIVAQNYGQTGKTFSQGNIDYSANGNVDFDDLLLLAQRYGTSLAVKPSTGVAPGRKGRAASVVLV